MPKGSLLHCRPSSSLSIGPDSIRNGAWQLPSPLTHAALPPPAALAVDDDGIVPPLLLDVPQNVLHVRRENPDHLVLLHVDDFVQSPAMLPLCERDGTDFHSLLELC
eukprot:3275065-Rhodomonas_salina.1